MAIGWFDALGRLAVAAAVTLILLPLGVRADDGRVPLDAVQMRAIEQASSAVLGLQVRAVQDARSARTLGLQRQGSGVVIDKDGLVLTIGYLILEAESLWLLPADGRRIPARVVAYDLATGLGLVMPLVPLGIAPAALGRSASVTQVETLAIASGGAEALVSLARLLSRRPFAGYWEYHIDGALFTAPPRRDHSGAALFNARGELVGVGSLLVRDAAVPGVADDPGNMFVPVDLLAPILAELRAHGRSAASARAWLGVNCAERDGEVIVLRVSDESPADLAGLLPGDRIVSIDGLAVTGLAALWQALWKGGPAERAVRLQIRRDAGVLDVVVHAVDRMRTLRSAKGI